MIEISGSETLDKLCAVILRAFDFTDEHMYEFCMTNQMYHRKNYMVEPEERGQPSTNTKIDALGLSEGQIFSLHYDFGDDWMFAIRVEQITDAPRTKPVVTGFAGYVEQYPNYDEEDEEDEWDDHDDNEDLFPLRQANQEYLKLFESDLRAAALSENTIERHVDNASYYIDNFVPRYSEGWTMVDGVSPTNLRAFFGDYYINECLWSTPNNLKTTAASIKKFYRCMMEHGYIEASAYQALCDLFKRSVAEWQQACRDAEDEDPGFWW